MRDDERRIVVTVPADRDLVLVLRLVARSVASIADLPVDDISDMELAVAEAAAALLPLTPPRGELSMTACFAPSHTRFSLSAPTIDAEVGVATEELPWRTLRGVDPAVHDTRVGGTLTLDFGRTREGDR